MPVEVEHRLVLPGISGRGVLRLPSRTVHRGPCRLPADGATAATARGRRGHRDVLDRAERRRLAFGGRRISLCQLRRFGDDVLERGIRIVLEGEGVGGLDQDRKSTRLNSSHVAISYAVFCLKKKKRKNYKKRQVT